MTSATLATEPRRPKILLPYVLICALVAIATVSLAGSNLRQAFAQTCSETAFVPQISFSYIDSEGQYRCDTGELITDYTATQGKPTTGGAWNNLYGSSNVEADQGAHTYQHYSNWAIFSCGWLYRGRAEVDDYYGHDTVDWSGANVYC